MKPDRKVIGELVVGYRKAKILFTAASMNLFSLTRRAISAGAIRKALGTDLRATCIFLDALAAMGFLRKKTAFTATCRLPPGSSCRDKTVYGPQSQYQDIIWEAWSRLGKIIKNGVPPVALKAFVGAFPVS